MGIFDSYFSSDADPDFPDIYKNLPEETRRAFDAAYRTQKTGYSLDEQNRQIISGSGVVAGYKIEVRFMQDRSHQHDFTAQIYLWESGKELNGDGDGWMYLCADHWIFETMKQPSILPLLRATEKADPLRSKGCGYPIPPSQMDELQAICSRCGIRKPIDLTAPMPFFGSVTELAETVEILFRRLRFNADIYCKFDKRDIRYNQKEKDFSFEKAREDRDRSIYPLARLMKDAASGTSLRKLLVAFFSA